MKKIKLFLIAGLIAITALLSIKATFQAGDDSFFEISKNLDIFATIYRDLNTYYVDEIQPGELMKAGIDAMLNSLDPYTNYIPESQIEDYRFITTGQYGGIGALIRKSGDHFVITDVYEDFPAQKNGLRAGDKLIEIDGNSVVGKSTDDISKFLKGEPKSTVKILYERGFGDAAEQLTKSIVREEVKVKDVPYYGMVDDHTGYIVLSSFTRTASKEFEEAFMKLKENPEMNQLIFDLRGNGGGLLNEAVNIVNKFVPKGTKVVETKGKVPSNNQTYKALNPPIALELPIAILINGNSASASEIVAGAIQDLDRGLVVGKRSFGKGLVQHAKPISYKAQLKITVAKYYIPSGRCIQKIDYSNRNKSGKASNVPDSLIKTFSSLKNKRPLHDGKGINPDLEVEARTMSAISSVLMSKMYIFDYATMYHASHDTIAAPVEFRLSDEEYNEFMNYLSDKDYSYETQTEKMLERLKKTAEEEQYYELAKGEYEALSNKMALDKKEDLVKFKSEIKELIEYEIVSRYYFEHGKIASSLSRDPVLLTAISALSDKDKYSSILKGTYKEESPQD